MAERNSRGVRRSRLPAGRMGDHTLFCVVTHSQRQRANFEVIVGNKRGIFILDTFTVQIAH